MEYICKFCGGWAKYKEPKLPPYICAECSKTRNTNTKTLYENANCDICGVSYAVENRNDRFCNACTAFMQKRTGREHSRTYTRLRDKFTCQDCGEKRLPNTGVRMLDIHHLNGECGKKSRDYDLIENMGNLITLCHRCHFNRHDWRGGHRNYKVEERGNEKWKALA